MKVALLAVRIETTSGLPANSAGNQMGGMGARTGVRPKGNGAGSVASGAAGTVASNIEAGKISMSDCETSKTTSIAPINRSRSCLLRVGHCTTAWYDTFFLL